MTTPQSTPSLCVNDFVTKLVRLQQDGKEAISGPANWLKPPLLEVDTETVQGIEEIIDAVAPGRGKAGRGRWHWLIGSPGNGKSAKLGQIARRLLKSGFEIVDDRGASLEEQTSEDWLPYLLEVREVGKPYRFAYLVQDASVVRRPFGSDCNPASDLRAILRDAWHRGLSLLLCTNWGVLQRLFDEGHTDRSINREGWFKAVSMAVSHSGKTPRIHSGAGKTVFSEIDITYEYLDNRSLLVGSNTFTNLLDKATTESQWEACTACPSRNLCPMRANRDDLSSGRIGQRVVETLGRAETLSGQTIVFREAVALVSLFLAGCPNDHGERLPCEWVHDQVRSGSAFSLLARRLPMLLFGASKPYGLTGDGRNGSKVNAVKITERRALNALCSLLDQSPAARQALESVIRGGEISSDVGVDRLLGPDGAVTRLDPSLDPRHSRQLDEFLASVTSRTFPLGIRDIERSCLKHWKVMFDAAEAGQNPSQGSDIFFWLRRWQTTCLAWMAATSYDLNALQSELDTYQSFCIISVKTNSDRANILRLERQLESTLTPGKRNLHIQLSESMWLTGRWAERELRPSLQKQDKSHAKVLRIKVGENHSFIVSAETFAWLWRRQELGLSEFSFRPEVLDALRRTQAQAAAASRYSFQDDDVTIVVTDDHGKEQRLERTRGELVEGAQEN